MITTAKITSQGQMTIPSFLRKITGIKRGDEVMLEKTDDGILIKKMGSVDDLIGFFKNKALKNKTIDEIMKIEKEAIEEGYIERYLRSQK